jgi:hypothetical protein
MICTWLRRRHIKVELDWTSQPCAC